MQNVSRFETHPMPADYELLIPRASSKHMRTERSRASGQTIENEVRATHDEWENVLLCAFADETNHDLWPMIIRIHTNDLLTL